VDLTALRDFAHELADVADRLSMASFGGPVPAVAKPDGTPVTEADEAIERTLRERIVEAHPDHAVFGEEGGGRLDGDVPTWVIDPIDGTKNFMRGVPVFATLVALVVDRQPVLGVVSAPGMATRWDGADGLGARQNGTAIGVSSIASIGAAHLCHGDADRLRELPALWDAFGRLHDDAWRMRGFGDFWNHMLVAAGAADAAFERELPPWDVAALAPIVREAGGRVTDVHGVDVLAPGHAARPNLVVSSNGLLHDALCARLAPAVAIE
jgi:histidinol-phosphatase